MLAVQALDKSVGVANCRTMDSGMRKLAANALAWRSELRDAEWRIG